MLARIDKGQLPFRSCQARRSTEFIETNFPKVKIIFIIFLTILWVFLQWACGNKDHTVISKQAPARCAPLP
jgi:hypothetical protein